MTFPVHTQKSLDKLTWPEVQKLHKSLGLKATAEARTRRDYQNRIVAAQSQPVIEPEHTVTPLTCETCSLARLIDGNRYCCGLTDAVTRGNWEAKTDCYDAVAQAQTKTETETIEPATETEAPIAFVESTPQAIIVQPEAQAAAPKTFSHPFCYRADIHQGQHSFSSAMYGLCECNKCKAPQVNEIEQLSALITDLESTPTVAATTDDAPPNRGDNGRNRISAEVPMTTPSRTATIAPRRATKADDNFMTAFTKESEFDHKFNDINYLLELQTKAQLAIERTEIGSEEEAIAYRHLRMIEKDIEFYSRPQPDLQSSSAVAQLEIQMAKLKAEVKQQFTIDTSILTNDKPNPVPVSLDPEGTIHWHGPLQGTITGKKGVLRNFYIRSRNCLVDVNLSNPATYEVMLVVSADFTAAEYKRPNVRHHQIRSAIESGRTFDPKGFKESPQFLTDTENYRDIGRIMEGSDGRWWAWLNGGITGQPFVCENLACKYLDLAVDRHNQAQNLQACAN